MFIPSLKKEIEFKPLTIEQFNIITYNDQIHPNLNLGFNISFIETLKNNCTEDIILTNFDKNIIGLQIHLNELKENNIDFNLLNIEHPASKTIKSDSYTFNLLIPSIDIDLETCNYIIDNNINDLNLLLLCEISKHIESIYLNDTDINYPKNIVDRLSFLKKIPPNTLVKCMIYIDKVKTDISLFYSTISNNSKLKYDISLLVP